MLTEVIARNHQVPVSAVREARDHATRGGMRAWCITSPLYALAVHPDPLERPAAHGRARVAVLSLLVLSVPATAAG